ncbi:MAG: putative DNA polymerase [Prokaryotic dsDNA virus sp.]|jgi:DNA polymerase I-like protein with 3'-5' exonuclease and polymerase domains|nr:MAG: putative DNA polymerase [Prokaryotic dsDNA virus sp.]|tara:strand:- start:27944 stop:30040 length:2097 start_codon:yes stop_codon:yes gene_type:complete
MAKKPDTKVADRGGPMQLGFFTPDSDWKPRQVSTLPSWEGIDRVGFDCETRDPDLRSLGPGPRRDGYTTGYSVALEKDGRIVDSFYLPKRHEGGDNLPEQEVDRYLADNLKKFKGEYVGANLSYDIDYATAGDGFKFHPDALFRDVQIADPLIYELHMSYSLKNIGDRWGLESKDNKVLVQAARSMGVDPGAGMWRLPARYVGAYAERDCESPLELYAKMRKKIDENNLWQVFDLETQLLPVLVRMRQRGVRIDQDRLAQIEQRALREEIDLLAFIKDKTGVNVGLGDVWKPDALEPALTATGFKVGRTATGKPQIDADMLESLNDPVAKAISHARKVNKLRTTFAASMRTHMVNGRIHCTFNQIAREDEKGEQKGVRYGRLSAVDPNLQQQYSPDRVGPDDPQIILEWRKIFIPEEGAIWGCNDYSQQEPRWTTHFAAVLDLPKAAEAARRYREDPSTDNHDMMTRLIHGDDQVDEWLALKKDGDTSYKVNRGHAKGIFLGKCYGEGGVKLCMDIGQPTRWAHIIGWGRNKTIEYFESRHEAWKARGSSGQGFVKEMAGAEGQAIMDHFDQEIPYIKGVADKASERAASLGYVRTVMGRRLHFPTREDGSYDWTHKALNRVIQGSSADQTKKAIIDLDRAGHFIQLQVHDETDGSFGSVAEATDAGNIMRDSILDVCTPLVPFKVDTECGPNWGEIK